MNLVAQQDPPKQDSPEIDPTLAVFLFRSAQNGGCYGSFEYQNPECSKCLLQRSCETRLALEIGTIVSDLTKLDSIEEQSGVQGLTTTSARIPKPKIRTSTAVGKPPQP